MNIILFFADGTNINLGKPKTLKILESYDTPAHNMIATFPYKNTISNAIKAQVVDREKIIFEGNVDEQIISVSKSGKILTIDARSSSELLDNEAYPATYHNPSLQEIYKIHAKPYGVKGVLGDGILDGDFAVTKGMSEWEVISGFCKSVFDVQPQITSDGYLSIEENPSNTKPVIFSNEKSCAYSFYEAKIRNKRYGVISQIVYKPETKSAYQYGINNPYLKDKSINVRRLINLSDLQNYERKSALEKAFKKSMANSFEIEIKTNPHIDCEVGDSAGFYEDDIGAFKDLIVYEKQYVIGSGGEYCRIVLRPKENI